MIAHYQEKAHCILVTKKTEDQFQIVGEIAKLVFCVCAGHVGDVYYDHIKV